jgi:hypothetical protein
MAGRERVQIRRPPALGVDGIAAGTMAEAAPAMATGGHGSTPPATHITFERRGQFAWKTALLLATTISLVPILLSKHVLAAKVYLVALVVVHVAGIVVIAVGVKRHHIAPDTRGLVIRLVAIAFLLVLLWVASKGLATSTADLLFWGSLFAIWALHTLGLALLHVRGARENAMCPFV